MTIDDTRPCRHTPPAKPVSAYAVVKRSVMVGGHKTSVSLEDAFWHCLKEITARRGVTLSAQLHSIDLHRRTGNLSSAIRLFVLDHYRARAISMMMVGECRSAAPNLAPTAEAVAAGDAPAEANELTSS